MGYVRLPDVAVFSRVRHDKEQALKVLEEAAEVFGSWQKLDGHAQIFGDESWLDGRETFRKFLIDECADVIQATCNLLASIGVEDMSDAMRECEMRNRSRGRY